MATFNATVYEITVEAHPNADAIEVARVGDYLSIIPKGYLVTGDRAVYIPEGAIVPEYIQEEVGCLGKLAGSGKNRVKAATLRGILSQGLCYKARPGWEIGMDMAEQLGITKYEPPIPAKLAGEISNIGQENTFNFDIENVKKFPDIIQEGELVSFTEKLHGTFTVVGTVYGMEHPDLVDGKSFVSSKGHFAKGLVIRNNAANENNTYVRIAKKFKLYEISQILSERYQNNVYITGETFGDIQDLRYGLKQGEFDFRVFSIFVGSRSHRQSIKALNDDELEAVLAEFGLKRVPVLYKGPFSKTLMLEYTDGKETYSGQETHMREGLIVVPLEERKVSTLPNGRVILKSISKDYLLRKGGTEFN